MFINTCWGKVINLDGRTSVIAVVAICAYIKGLPFLCYSSLNSRSDLWPFFQPYMKGRWTQGMSLLLNDHPAWWLSTTLGPYVDRSCIPHQGNFLKGCSPSVPSPFVSCMKSMLSIHWQYKQRHLNMLPNHSLVTKMGGRASCSYQIASLSSRGRRRQWYPLTILGTVTHPWGIEPAQCSLMQTWAILCFHYHHHQVIG